MWRILYGVGDMSLNSNNFFELFGLPVLFELDKSALKARFLQLQKQHHPDTSQDAHAEKNTALINHAFKTLNGDDSRAVYLLSLHDVVLDDTQSISDLAFLDDMLDIRFALEEECQNQADFLALLGQVQSQIDEYAHHFHQAFGQSDFITASDNAKKLQFLVKLYADIDDHLKNFSTSTPQNDDDLYV